nr:MAG TPA: hypothetical protein [Caudoviricetes sp.]
MGLEISPIFFYLLEMSIYSFSLIHYHFNQMNCLAGAWRN